MKCCQNNGEHGINYNFTKPNTNESDGLEKPLKKEKRPIFLF